MLKIAVLVSGSGSNLQSIIDEIEEGKLNCSIECVIADKTQAFGLERARKHNIAAYGLSKKELKDNLSDGILKIIDGKVDLIVLAGFLSILKGNIIEKFKDKIINIHPSLIPSFCGNGMYGIRVHEAAIKYGVRVSGCTVHFVDEGTDTGHIILQKAVAVKCEDSAEDLQKRILVQEHIALPEAIGLIADGRVSIVDGKVIIK
ncbi:formyltetrahydrofolate-dependent phosphoribosylglycinamide formyltransferase [Hathewaya proteolytica DSM 3090]|uniref:Phosphoribosylglycinamide formyltransferase n=1 Tax=Hathewaya proteolytica DSM 3090 TaxID=1121331 RepID=A0A1M6P684_9CLOT|nr:phosphoribosylglycinamide formyltransferase [Hathewaya proteolytica]SHK03386.1 formyltetrahydrofolate-dependent phosphoribosylglycinamide formyltransferase [Hathewaya proteolytica DSM 3090]